MRRFALILIGLSAILLSIAFWLQKSEAPSSADAAGRGYGQAQIGGAFEAVDHRAKPITDAALKGKYSLVFFGFTYCPDICPTSLLNIAEALDLLPADLQANLIPAFVTVDPQRDTAEVMAQYVSNFHPRIIGITGTAEQMDALAKAYKVYYSKVPSDGASDQDYLVDHSGYLYLMGPDGAYLKHFPHNVTSQRLADGLRSHMVAQQ